MNRNASNEVSASPAKVNQTPRSSNTANPLYDFLKPKDVALPKGAKDHTHTSLGGLFSFMSLKIPDDLYDGFLEAYAATLDWNATHPNRRLGFTEAHQDIAPFLIDLDFRLPSPEREYDQDFVINFIEKVFEVLYEFVELPGSTEVYVLEKSTPRADPKSKMGEYKDGLHIVVPDIVTRPELQYKVRQKFIEYYPDYFTIVSPNKSNADAVYDRSVIKQNGWFLYGSCKPDDVSPYKLTYIHTVDHLCKIFNQQKVENPHDPMYIAKLSIRNKDETTLTLKAKHKEVNETASVASKVSESHRSVTTTCDEENIDIQFIEDLVNCLSVKRADEYNDWRRVGWCLKNISSHDDLLRIWINFSKRSKAYELQAEESCKDHWNRNDSVDPSSKDAVKMGSLIKWAREDNMTMANKAEYAYHLRRTNIDQNIDFEDFMEQKEHHNGTLHYSILKRIFEKSNIKILDQACYAYIDMDRKCTVTLIMYDRHKFRERYYNMHCYVNEQRGAKFVRIKKRFVEIWFEDCNIRTYKYIDFCPPPTKCPNNVFNIWGGFAIDNVECESSGHVQPFINHLSLLVNHVQAALEYVIWWFAHMIQRPGELNGIALVIISKEGAGKNRLCETFAKIIGEDYYFETASPQTHLFGRFSNGRRNKLLIDIDEAKSKDTFAMSEELKNMITCQTFNYEQKGVDPITMRNFARVIFTTNNDLCIKLTSNSRRYVVFEASSEKVGDNKYFAEYSEYMDDPRNQKAIIEYLRSVDISKVNWIKDRPISDAYRAMQQQCAEIHIRFLEHLYLKHLNEPEIVYAGRQLFNAFKDFMTRVARMRDDVTQSWNETRFGKKITQLIDEFPDTIVKFNNAQRCRSYRFVKDKMEAMLKKHGMLTEMSYMFLEDPEDDPIDPMS
jgi:hypothetical protein